MSNTHGIHGYTPITLVIGLECDLDADVIDLPDGILLKIFGAIVYRTIGFCLTVKLLVS